MVFYKKYFIVNNKMYKVNNDSIIKIGYIYNDYITYKNNNKY